MEFFYGAVTGICLISIVFELQKQRRLNKFKQGLKRIAEITDRQSKETLRAHKEARRMLAEAQEHLDAIRKLHLSEGERLASYGTREK